jgi:hypothetical protein
MSAIPVTTDVLRPPSQGPGGARPLGPFHIATLVMQRARQLDRGARPRTETNGHRHYRVALIEVLLGAVEWSVSAPGTDAA